MAARAARGIALVMALACAAPLREKSPKAQRLFAELSCGEFDCAEDCEALVGIHLSIGVEGWAGGTSFCTWPGVLCDPRDFRVVGVSLRDHDLRGPEAPEKVEDRKAAHKRAAAAPAAVSYKGKRELSATEKKALLAEAEKAKKKAQAEANRTAEEAPIARVPLTEKSCAVRPRFPAAAVARLARLESLTMVGLNMTGPIGDELNALRHLEELHLSENFLTGPLPRLRGPARLAALHLDGNALTGGVVDALDALRAPDALRRLGLSRNDLDGPLPSATLARFENLETLAVGGNRLGGPFPADALEDLDRLENVSAWGNAFTGDAARVVEDAPPALRRLDLSANSMHGDLADVVGSRLQVLRLGGNRLTGDLPPPAEVKDLHHVDLRAPPGFAGDRSRASDCALEPACGGAAAAGLALVSATDVVPRVENGEDVPGTLYVLTTAL
mmetsp:Transcript_7262/g.23868  ORF Transcript_7262/g.23868 Transcript_7262/m.23868 type:complete len:444 (-) Transcript_7262:33-1364(-)